MVEPNPPKYLVVFDAFTTLFYIDPDTLEPTAHFEAL